MPRRDLVLITTIYILACALYFAWSVAITEPGFPLDDSWIHQVFARNIATGHGFSYNPDHPVSGATAPLWSLLLAPFWRLSGPVAGGLVAGFLFEWLALIALYNLALVLTKQRGLALLATIIGTLSWPIVWCAMSGMEVGLYSALSLWGLYFYFKSDTLNDRRNYVAYLLLVLAILARPECAILLAAVIIRDFVEWSRSENKSLAPWGWRALIIIAFLAPYVVFNLRTTGTIFPQTFTAKVQGKGLMTALIHGESKRIVKTLTVLPAMYIQDFSLKSFIVNPFMMLAFIAGVFKIVTFPDHLKSKRIMLAIAALLYVPLLGTLSPVLSPAFQGFRFTAHLLLILVMFGIAGLFWEIEFSAVRFARIALIAAILIFMGGVALIFSSSIIVNRLGPSLVQDITQKTPRDMVILKWFVRDMGFKNLLLAVLLVSGAVLTYKKVQMAMTVPRLRRMITGLVILYALIILVVKGDYYANNVKNINDCDKMAGLYLAGIGKPGDCVGINDIGAIGYYADMDILDLKGLISPQITPQMIQNDSLAFEYMNREKRVDYLAIMPDWFEYIPRRTDIFKPIAYFVTGRNTILSEDSTVVYKAFWPETNR